MTHVKPMTLAEYQTAASTTALPTAYDYEYLIPGLISEVGEMHGKLAKAHRDGWGSTRLQEELTKELGDVCWMVAILLARLGVHGEDDFKFWTISRSTARSRYDGIFTPTNPVMSSMEALRASVERITNMLDSHLHLKDTGIYTFTKVYFTQRCVILWFMLGMVSVSLTGHSLDYVLRGNLAKLADRKARGTIEGSGDNR